MLLSLPSKLKMHVEGFLFFFLKFSSKKKKPAEPSCDKSCEDFVRAWVKVGLQTLRLALGSRPSRYFSSSRVPSD